MLSATITVRVVRETGWRCGDRIYAAGDILDAPREHVEEAMPYGVIEKCDPPAEAEPVQPEATQRPAASPVRKSK